MIPAEWTSNGYYTYIYLCELSFVRTIFDPSGVLKELQEMTCVYLEELRRSIVDTFMSRAGAWLNNFHYESANRRQDLLFCGPVVQHTLLDMMQVFFAPNRRYFPGDKNRSGTEKYRLLSRVAAGTA